jgi:hypothetical protein
MALQDDQLNRLFDAVVVARRRYVATGFAGVSKSVTEMEEVTLMSLRKLTPPKRPGK